MEILFVGLLLLFAIAAFESYSQWRRREDLRAEAARRGFAFFPDGGAVTAEGLPHGLFHRGSRRRLTNLLEVPGSPRVRIFDYLYRTAGGRRSYDHVQTVAAFQRSGSSLPSFELGPEVFFHRLGEIVGIIADIDFDASPAFSQSYRLIGEDEAAVRSLFPPEVLAALAAEPGWSVEGAGQTLLVYRAARLVEAKGLAAFLEKARAIAALFGPR